MQLIFTLLQIITGENLSIYSDSHAHITHTCKVSQVKKTGDNLCVSLIPNTTDGKAQDITDVNCLLWAIGRDANMVELGISNTQVHINRRGFIEADEFQNTNVKNLYALGDIAGNKLLTPGN